MTVLVCAACIGIIVGLRTTRPRWIAMLLLGLGIAVPLVLYFLALKATTGRTTLTMKGLS